MLLITYQHRPVALAGTSRFYLAPEIAELADPDPLKTFVCFLALYARDLQIGAIPGDPTCYRPIPAERYAREALIPSPDSPPCRINQTTSSPRTLAYHRNRSDVGARTSPEGSTPRPVGRHGVTRGLGVGAE